MLGIAVLVMCGLYVGLALSVVQRVGSKRKFAKVLMGAVFALIPTWDIIPGQLYHQYLCKTEGGIQVFKTVEVDRTYFLPDGQPDEEKLGHRFDRPSIVDRAYSKVFHITKYQRSIVDKETGDNMGTATDYWYSGGWLKKAVLPDSASEVCPRYPNHTVSSSLWKKVILLRSEAKSGGL